MHDEFDDFQDDFGSGGIPVTDNAVATLYENATDFSARTTPIILQVLMCGCCWCDLDYVIETYLNRTTNQLQLRWCR